MVDIWKKYNSSKSYDEYFNLDNKLRKQAKTMSGILERYGIKKLNEIEKNCQSTIIKMRISPDMVKTLL